MDSKTEEPVDAVLCFDANLPKMHHCSAQCENNPMVLCRHRFNFKTEIRYYNTEQFRNYAGTKKGWPDSKILLHVLDHVRSGIRNGSLISGIPVVILTKDVDFLKDAEIELGRNVRGNDLVFLGSYVTCGDITVHVILLDCKNYGTKGTDNLKCAIYKMNEFFKRRLRA